MNIDSEKHVILLTGCCGFIGAALVRKVISEWGDAEVIGIDSMNDYYDVSLKEHRLREIEKCASDHPRATWRFIKGNIADKALIDEVQRRCDRACAILPSGTMSSIRRANDQEMRRKIF